MKRFEQLTLEDIRLHPVWRYNSVGDDTVAWVEVDDRPQLSEQDSDTFIASTTFLLADGSVLTGLCSPSDPSGLDYLQPVIITAAGHVPLWDEKASGNLAASVSKHLAKGTGLVFPLTFECSIPVDGARVSGTVGLSDATSAEQCMTLVVRLLPSE